MRILQRVGQISISKGVRQTILVAFVGKMSERKNESLIARGGVASNCSRKQQKIRASET